MKSEVARTIADSAATVAITTGAATGASRYFGWFEFVNQNAGGIGVLISLVSLAVATTFYVLTYRKPDNSNANEERIKAVEKAMKILAKKDSEEH